MPLLAPVTSATVMLPLPKYVVLADRYGRYARPLTSARALSSQGSDRPPRRVPASPARAGDARAGGHPRQRRAAGAGTAARGGRHAGGDQRRLLPAAGAG